MKSVGIVRQIDHMGRIVIPKELRMIYDINEKDALEIFTEDNRIILKKYEPSCVFCGDASDVIQHSGKNICRSCAKEIAGNIKE